MRKAAQALAVLAALALPASTLAVASETPETVPTPVPKKGDRQDKLPKSTAKERQAARLDTMFARLAKTEDERRAKRIARHIMRRLNQSGSDTTDLLMEQAGRAMQAKEFPKALDLLDGVVRLQPDFAEGWNRRATVYFMMGDYGRSVADIEHVLQLEPRHWGALAGLSMIFVSLDRKEEALAVMDRALAIHPFLERMKERRDRLSQEVGGSDI